VFEINNFNLLKVNEYFYEMDNFYKNPHEVNSFFDSVAPVIHKWSEKDSLNTHDFLDCQHHVVAEEFKETEKKIYNLFNRDCKNIKGDIITNFTKFQNIKEDYKNNYWWPHQDDNFYNCIIYLNEDPCDGTNIYEKINEHDNVGTEHSTPWQKKENFKLLCNIKSKFNKLVVFRSNLIHGLAYDNNKFKNKFRKNQVIFIF